MQIQWPQGVDTAGFLRDYWQQKPLLIREAFADFETPLDENELAGLLLDPDANARYMECHDGHEWRMTHGPFEQDFFDSVSGSQWSILVSDIEKLLPDFRAYLQPFRFLPDWRIDDLMISYAPVGGSVGAHVDQYDVFLLQASGTREWQIEHTARPPNNASSNANISLLADFKADETMQLSSGDMLYLPPGFAHHGIAKQDPCTTWSIGFRAPSIDEMLPAVISRLIDTLPDYPRFTDAGRAVVNNPGEITRHDFKQLRQMIRDALQATDTQLDQCIGQYLTESVDEETTPQRKNSWQQLSESNGVLVCNSAISLAYQVQGNNCCLFAKGDAFTVSEKLAKQLCNTRQVPLSAVSNSDQSTIAELYNRSILLDEEDEQ